MRVRFECQGGEGREVALRGDFSSWKRSHPMSEFESGRYEATLELAAGIYQYKFLVDRRCWVLDGGSPWRDETGSFINSSIVVGGSRPPLFFAPCRRCWAVRDGELAVHAELEREASIPGHLLLRDGAGRLLTGHSIEASSTMCNRRLLVSHGSVPRAARTAEFDGYPGRWSLPSPEHERQPAWLRRAVIYSIFVDRWQRGACSSPDPRAVSRGVPSGPSVVYGGDLFGIAEAVPWFVELGVDALLLTPIHCSDSSHRYDAKDFDTVDPRLGGERGLGALLAACHRAGLRLMLDAAFTHCDVEHPWFEDLLRNQGSSPYASWFMVNRLPVSLASPESYAHYPDCPRLPLLRLAEPAVLDHFERLIRRWTSLGVDGLRFDAVELAEPAVWRRLAAAAERQNPEVGLIAEVIFETPDWAVDHLGVHAATDYARYQAIASGLQAQPRVTDGLRATVQLARHRLGPWRASAALQFVDTHDTDRLLTRTQSEQALLNALEFLLDGSEPLLLNYGTELALSSGVVSDRPDGPWPDRLPMPPLRDVPGFTSSVRHWLRRRRADS